MRPQFMYSHLISGLHSVTGARSDSLACRYYVKSAQILASKGDFLPAEASALGIFLLFALLEPQNVMG